MESSGWHDPQAHEKEPTDREAGIKIQKLTKVYDQVKIQHLRLTDVYKYSYICIYSLSAVHTKIINPHIYM